MAHHFVRRLGPLGLLTVLSGALAACGGAAPAPTTPTTMAATDDGMKGANVVGESVGTEQHVKNVEIPAAIRAIVDAPDRDPEDRTLDAGRKPAELLAFAGIKPGMKVAELFAGGGYTTELLARAVGPTGVVYGQNTAGILEMFAEKPWTARLAKPADKNVVKVTRELDDPLPPEAKDLDAVFMVLVYHDTVWLKADRAKMNAAIFKALKPGGEFIIVDHSGPPGTGATETQTRHRIEERVVRKDVSAAGFQLVADADFLRNASPDAGEKRGTSDRFVLKFVKP